MTAEEDVGGIKAAPEGVDTARGEAAVAAMEGGSGVGGRFWNSSTTSLRARLKSEWTEKKLSAGAPVTRNDEGSIQG